MYKMVFSHLCLVMSVSVYITYCFSCPIAVQTEFSQKLYAYFCPYHFKWAESNHRFIFVIVCLDLVLNFLSHFDSGDIFIYQFLLFKQSKEKFKWIVLISFFVIDSTNISVSNSLLLIFDTLFLIFFSYLNCGRFYFSNITASSYFISSYNATLTLFCWEQRSNLLQVRAGLGDLFLLNRMQWKPRP